MPTGPAGEALVSTAPRPAAADAVTSRYCRPPCSYIEGAPLVAPPNWSSHTCLPVALSYTCTLRSAAVANTSPVAVTTRPPLVVAAVPVPVTPWLTRRRSSPRPICHLIVALFKSYAVNVVYGGLMMVGYRPKPCV